MKIQKLKDCWKRIINFLFAPDPVLPDYEYVAKNYPVTNKVRAKIKLKIDGVSKVGHEFELMSMQFNGIWVKANKEGNPLFLTNNEFDFI